MIRYKSATAVIFRPDLIGNKPAKDKFLIGDKEVLI